MGEMSLTLCPGGGISQWGTLLSVLRQRNPLRVHGSQPARFSQAVHISPQICIQRHQRVTMDVFVPHATLCLVTQSCPTLQTWAAPTSLLCPWNFPGKNTGVGCHFLLQGISPTQGLNPHLFSLLHWQADSISLLPPGKVYLHHGNQQML